MELQITYVESSVQMWAIDISVGSSSPNPLIDMNKTIKQCNLQSGAIVIQHDAWRTARDHGCQFSGEPENPGVLKILRLFNSSNINKNFV